MGNNNTPKKKEEVSTQEIKEAFNPSEEKKVEEKQQKVIEIDEELSKAIGKERVLEEVFAKTITEEDVKAQSQSQERNPSNELFEARNVHMKTELNSKEIIAISKLLFISDRYIIPAYEDFVNNYMALKISHKRLGRREFIDALHAEQRREEGEGNAFQKMWSKFRGAE